MVAWKACVLDAVRGHQARIRTHSGGLNRDWSIPSMHQQGPFVDVLGLVYMHAILGCSITAHLRKILKLLIRPVYILGYNVYLLVSLINTSSRYD